METPLMKKYHYVKYKKMYNVSIKIK